MPTIVELPDKTELEFPDGMDEIAMRRAIVDTFPQFAQPLPSERPSIPAPGEALPSMSTAPVPTRFELGQPPSLVQRYKEDPGTPLTAEEAEQMVMHPQVQIPRFGEPGTATRGFSEVISSVPEFLSTPAAPYIMMAQRVPGLREAVDMLFAAAMTKSGAEKLGEYKATGNRQALVEGLGAGGLGLLGAGGAAAPHLAFPELLRGVEPIGTPESIDLAARRRLSIEQPAETQTPIQPPMTMEPVTGKGVSIPKARELTAPEAEDVFGLGKLSEADNAVIAEASKVLPQAAAELKAEPQAPAPTPEPTPPAKVEAPAKEPWQMTREEFAPKRGKIVENPNRAWDEPSHIEIDPVTGKPFSGDPRETVSIGQVGQFYRAGKLPESGRSFDYKSQTSLAGVSVYPLPAARSMAGLKSADWHTGQGKVIGFGPDGEPLIEPIGKWQKFSGKKSSDLVGDAHKFHIKEALAQGKPVPPEVLAEYPDLAPKPAAKSAVETTPVAAAAKVEQKVKAVAKTEGQRSAKEVKSELVQRLEQAIKDAPSESEVRATSYTKADMERVEVPDRAEMVTIEIPGDGTFKIRNTKEALEGILKRAKRISTESVSAKATLPKGAVQSSEKALRGMEAAKEEQRVKGLGDLKAKARVQMHDALNKSPEEGIIGSTRPEEDPAIDGGTLFKEYRLRKTTPQEQADFWKSDRREIRWIGEMRVVRFDPTKGRTENEWGYASSGKTYADAMRQMVGDAMPANAVFQNEGAQAWHDLEYETGKFAFLSKEAKPHETPPTGPGMVGLGAAAAEGEPGFMRGGEGATAMKYRLIDAERAKRGLEPLTKPQSRTDQAVMDKAMAAVDRDPGLPERLIEELRGKPRPIEDWENHVLLLRKIDLRNEYAKTTHEIAQAFEDGRMDDVTAARVRLTEWSDKLTELEEASRLAGSERGRALRALRVMANEDYSLAAMETSLRAELGGRRLTDAEHARLEALAKEYQAKSAALESQLAVSEQARLEAVTRATLADIARQSAEKKIPAPHIQKLINRVGTAIHTAGQESREWLQGASFTISPEVMFHLSRVGADNIWTIGEDFGRWSTKMVEDIGERIKPHLQAVWEASKKLVEETWDRSSGKMPQKAVALAKQTVKKGDTPEIKQQKLLARLQDRHAKGQSGLLAPVVQKLARTFVEQGVRGVDELIDAVHQVISPIFGPDWTRRQTMDVISGYGDYKALSKDEISRELRTLKGQMQQMGKLEDMAAGQAPLRTGIERREITPSESQLIKLVNEAKRRGGYETTDPNRQLRTALDEVKKRTETRISELERRMKEGDFSVRKLTPIEPDPELVAQQAQLKNVQRRYEQMKRDAQLANRKGWQRALDKFVRWERAFKLSSPVVFGKLTAAALTRVAETATSELAGTGLRLLPGVRAVAKQAPREGSALNIPAMAKALARATTQGMKDAWETAKRGASNLDIVYGEKILDQDWANVFGQLHGMLKAPVKRFEFEYALKKRIEHAMRNGIDVADPAVQTRLMTEALNDGYRAIFMQRGFSSDMFNQFVTMMEKTKKPGYQPAGEISARMARFLLPVVRVPINIVAETGTGIYGAPVASMRVMFNVARGTLNKLDPVVADSIMRQFKKGSIGLGLMALGYFNPESIGGYDWREKRLAGEVKTGGFQVSGVDVPRWMTHAPWFELMQFGATIRHVKEQHARGEEKGISEGMWAAGFGLVEETPFVNQMLRMDKLFGTSQERAAYTGELLRGTLIPGAIQRAAQWSDREFGQPIQRKPETVWQNVQTGIPGMRQNVPMRLER